MANGVARDFLVLLPRHERYGKHDVTRERVGEVALTWDEDFSVLGIESNVFEMPEHFSARGGYVEIDAVCAGEIDPSAAVASS